MSNEIFVEGLAKCSKSIALFINNYTKAIWYGELWGFRNITDVNDKKTVFRIRNRASITWCQFTSDNKLLVTDAEGYFHLWNILVDPPYNISQSCYCPFENPLHRKQLTFDIISAASHHELLHSANIGQLIIGTSYGSIDSFIIEERGVRPLQHFLYGHTAYVTAIQHSEDGKLFTTAALDGDISIWDLRMKHPIVAYGCDPSGLGITAILQNGNDLCAGNVAGDVFQMDVRNMKTIINVQRIFNKPIRKFRKQLFMNCMAVIAESNVIKFLTPNTNAVLYEDLTATDVVRDLYWPNENSFYSVLRNGNVKLHVLNVNQM